MNVRRIAEILNAKIAHSVDPAYGTYINSACGSGMMSDDGVLSILRLRK